MATTVSIDFDHACTGGHHLTFNVSVNGGASQQVSYVVDELAEAITWEDAREIVRDLLRMHFRDKTKAEIQAEFQAGVVDLTI